MGLPRHLQFLGIYYTRFVPRKERKNCGERDQWVTGWQGVTVTPSSLGYALSGFSKNTTVTIVKEACQKRIGKPEPQLLRQCVLSELNLNAPLGQLLNFEP